MRSKPDTVSLERAVHDRLVEMFIFFVRENIRLTKEIAALREQSNSKE